ncbi:DUF4129 domain-containing protein [Vulcanisaeta distributa]|uniref:DUF4129 domain-containing protein n=1 Tax=Vulcanisaeta distributa TaxID=164451 RepID=UPI0006D27E57|nr:DUF4129 domain-containing protein [Vulcanisaeta distributa]
MPFTVSNGAYPELHPEGEVVGNALVFHSPGCHVIRVRVGNDIAESHKILIVEDYGQDIMSAFRANMAMHGLEGIENKTPREVCMELASRGGLMSEANCESWVSLRVFEAVRYGHVDIDRKSYEDFIRGLTKLRDALVMGGCPA